ncbi:hypothetical protein CAEBREN_13411 [Caenorhabditis brenneri]|uniref:Uncharacterized protein n=1 Tax=Caenorhabditis brenneri TaxID=135651 RepID=G0NQM5_CAEBE|nr:hypothetical protein CAEBREN_13411 [Caenorhabditis brenneri]
MGKKTKTEKRLFDVAHRQADEYIDEHKVEKIDEFKSGPCEDEDRDAPLLTGFGAAEDLDTLGAEGRHMRTDHVGDIGAFLESCPHLDAVRALDLLSELSLKKAIERGETMVMTPRGFVANWIVTQVDEPTDRYFRKADAEHKKFVREVRRLGDAYEPAPVQKIKELEKSITDAADPAKVNECYQRVNWADALEAERKLAAKLLQAKQKKTKKSKKKSKKGKNFAIKKVESKKKFKNKANNKKDSKLEVKIIKESGKDGKNTKGSKTKKAQKKKGTTNAFTNGECDGVVRSTTTVAAKKSVRSIKKHVTSKKSASSSKAKFNRSSCIRKVLNAKKSDTKVKNVMKKTQNSKKNRHISTTGERDRVIPSSYTVCTKKSTKPAAKHVTSEMSASSSKAKTKKNNCPRKVSSAKKNDTKVKKVTQKNRKKNNGTSSSAISDKTSSKSYTKLVASKECASSKTKSTKISRSNNVSPAIKKGTKIEKVKKASNKSIKKGKIIKK